MRSRLLLTISLVLALGAGLDATLYEGNVGLQTLGRFRADQAVEDGVPRDRSVPTLVGTAAQLGVEDGRYSLFLALRDVAPGAAIIVDERFPRWELSADFLRAMAAAGDIRYSDLDSITVPTISPTRQGVYRYGDWFLYTAPGAVGTVLIVGDEGTKSLIDARLLPDSPFEAAAPVPVERASSARTADQAPTLRRAIIAESSVLLLLLLLGGLLLPRAALRPTMRAAVALVVGVALHAGIGLVRLSGLWGLALTVLVACSAGLLSKVRGIEVGWSRADVRSLAFLGAGTAAVVSWARWTTFLALTPDSWRYWSSGSALADGNFQLPMFDPMRSPVQQSLHATGFALGIEGLQALGAVLLLTAAVVLVSDVAPRGRGATSFEIRRLAPSGIGVLALVLSPQVRTMAAYLNAHLMVAVLLLALVVLLAATSERHLQRALTPALGALILALVISRAEGAFLAGLVLVGTLGARYERAPWPAAWSLLGGSTLLWAAVLAAGNGVNTAVLLLGIAGAAAILGGHVLVRVRHELRRYAPHLIIGALWLATIYLFTLDSDNFLEIVAENVGRGYGGWGVFGPLLLLVAVAAVALSAGSDDLRTAPSRWFLIGFVPITALSRAVGDSETDIARLLSGASRVGWGDSVNRMWTHALLIAVLLFLRQMSTRREQVPGSTGSRRGIGAGLLATAILGGAIAVQWQPADLPRTLAEEQVLLSATGEVPIGELVAGSEVRQLMNVNVLDPGRGAHPTAFCIAVVFVTYDRENAGNITVTFEGLGWTVEELVDVANLADWAPYEVCKEIDGSTGAFASEVLVTVRGLDGRLGSSVSALEADYPVEFATATVPNGQGALTSRFTHPMALEASVQLRITEQSRLILRFVDASYRLLPWLLLFLLVHAVRAARHTASQAPAADST